MDDEERPPRFDTVDRILIGMGVLAVLLFVSLMGLLWVASLLGPKGD